MFHICDCSFDACFTTFECPDLECRYQSRVQAALEFAQGTDNIDKLVDPRRLYDHYLGPEPSKYVLRKILGEEKSMYISLSLFFFFSFLTSFFDFFFSQGWPPSKDKYARVKGMKNEPLFQLAVDMKKHKLNEEKSEMIIYSFVHTAPSSQTPSLEMMMVTPPTTHSKGKSKVGKSTWEDPTTAPGQVDDVITDEELNGLAFISSHELVNCHIHKLGNSSDHAYFAPSSHALMSLRKIRFVTSVYPFACGWPGDK